MANGFAGLREIAKQQKTSNFEDRPFIKYLKIPDGTHAVVRFLEQGDEVAWAWVHSFKPGPLKYAQDYVCLDQKEEGKHCPFCQSDIEQQIGQQKVVVSKRKVKGWINVIWRDAPKNEKVGDKWQQVGTEDQIAIWTSGIKVFEELDMIDARYKGLTSRDFRIDRKGERLETTYTILPNDVDGGPQAPSEADLALAAEKYDLSQFTTPLSVDDALKELSSDGGDGGVSRESVGTVTPFARRDAGSVAGNIFNR